MMSNPAWTVVSWQLTLTLLQISAAGIVIGVILATVHRLLRSASSSIRYGVNYSTLVFFFACLPVALIFNNSQQADAEFTPPQIVQLQPVPSLENGHNDSFLTDESRSVGESFANAVLPQEPGPLDVSEFRSGTDAGQWLSLHGHSLAVPIALLYLSGVVVMLCRLGWNIRRCEKLRTSCQPLFEGSVFECIRQQAGRLQLRLVPAVALCEQIAVPAIAGVLKPTILLPTAMVNGLSVEQLESVLLHELAHLRRADHVFIVLQRVIEAVLFFHPLTWYLSRRIHQDREQACDDMVLAAGTDPVRYAESLLRVAEWKSQPLASDQPSSTMLAIDGDQPSQLRQRIARMLGEPTSTEFGHSGRWVLVVVAAIMVCSFVVTTYADRGDEETKKSTTQDEVDSAVPIEKPVDTPQELLRLSERGRSIVESIKSAHVVFHQSSRGGVQVPGMNVGECRKLLKTYDLVAHPEQQTDLVRLLFEDPDKVVSPAWSEIELFTAGDQRRVSWSHGDVHITNETTSVRWDLGNVQMDIVPIDQNWYGLPSLYDFLRPSSLQEDQSSPGIRVSMQDGMVTASIPIGVHGNFDVQIDRETGLIHRATRFDANGGVVQESNWLGWTSQADSPPFPTVYAEFNFREGQLGRYDIRTVNKARFNVRLPEDIFRLGAPAGAVVRHHDAGQGRINREVFDVTNREQLKAAFESLSDELTPEEQAGVADARRLYTLKEDEILKRISPPFPRSRRYVSRMLGKRSADRPGEWSRLMSFNGTTFEQVFSHTNGSSRLGSHVQRLANRYGTDLEGAPELLDLVMPGDVVFRKSASVKELLDALKTVVEEDLQRPINIEFRTVKRPVFKAGGDFKLHLRDGQSRIMVNAGEHSGGDSYEASSHGSPQDLLQSLSVYISTRVVPETDLPDDRLEWQERRYNFFEKRKPEDRFEFDHKVVLAKVSEQTGLTFREEEHEVEILFVEFDE